MIKKIILGCMIALCGATASSQDKYQYNEYYYQRCSLFEQLPITDSDIVFVGNSLTNNCEWHELFSSPMVKNRGIISDVIQGIKDRIDPILIGRPKKLFLMGGVNDISHKVDADSIANALNNLILYIKEQSPSTELYLQSLLPINNDFGRYRNLKGTEPVFLDANIKLKEIAKSNDVTWINLYPYFLDENGKLMANLTSDGLHVNKAGYQIWGKVIEPYVGLKVANDIPCIKQEDIVLVGNSLIFGAEWAELLKNSNVKKRASGSNTIQGIAGNVNNILKSHPSKIILQSAINSYDNFNQDTIIAKTYSMIEEIKDKAPNTKIYLQSVLPINTSYKAYSKYSSLNSDIKNLNKSLRRIAKKNDIEWLDIYSLMIDKKGNLKTSYTNDGFHLLGPAYKVWSDYIKKKIQ